MSSDTELYSVMYGSGAVLDQSIFSPPGASPEPTSLHPRRLLDLAVRVEVHNLHVHTAPAVHPVMADDPLKPQLEPDETVCRTPRQRFVVVSQPHITAVRAVSSAYSGHVLGGRSHVRDRWTDCVAEGIDGLGTDASVWCGGWGLV